MKKMLFIAILSCLGSMVFAQKVYFIYIQSEAGTPFYIKMGEKVYSSTASGYVILPKLTDSTYLLFLGQPGNQAKELRFSVPINNSDHGFLLKKFQDGWALYDFQTMSVINPTPGTSGVMYESNSVKTDLFTRILAKAVDDSTLLMEPVMAKREEPKQPQKEEVKKKAAKDKDDAVAKVAEEVPGNETVAASVPSVDSTPVTTSPPSDSNVLKEIANNQTVSNDSGAKAVASTSPSKQAITSKETTVPQETSVPTETVAAKEIARAVDTSAEKDTSAAKETAVSQNASINEATASKENTAPKEVTAPKDAVVQNEQKVNSNQSKVDSGQLLSEASVQTSLKHSVVKKYAESSNFQGFGLTFIDTWEGVTDTIRLVIPNVVDASALVKTEQPKAIDLATGDKQASAGKKVSDPMTKELHPVNDDKVSAANRVLAEDKALAEKKASTADKPLVADIESKGSNPQVANPAPSTVDNPSPPVTTAREKDSIQATAAKDVVTAANCKEEASNGDFLELRKNMASKDRGEEMLDEARKAFKEKCYSTEQIRKLSVLFYTQEGKFLFFKEAKPYISDKDRFSTLLFEFHDDTYQERFKSLLEN